MSQGEVGLEPQCGQEGVFRLIKVTLFLEGSAEVDVGFDQPWVFLQGAVIGCDRRYQIAAAGLNDSQPIVGFGKIWSTFDRGAEVCLGRRSLFQTPEEQA